MAQRFASVRSCTAGESRAARKAPWACGTELRRRAAQDRSGAKGQVWQCTGNLTHLQACGGGLRVDAPVDARRPAAL